MRTIGPLMTRERSDDLVDRIEAGFEARGFGLWAVEVRASGAFAGFVGINVPGFDAPFMPCVEVGWRLAREHWGHGYATEGGREALRFAFEDAGLDEVVSFTAVINGRSRAVMERLGLVRDEAADFDHPNVPESSDLRRHVLYRITADRWRAAAA